MSERGLFKKVIWSVDPFAAKEVQEHALQALRALTKDMMAFIEPVYVLCPGAVGVMPEYYPDWEKAYAPAAEKALALLVKNSGLPTVTKPKVLVSGVISIRDSVEALLQHAKNSGADLIAVSTHAKTGVARFLAGSFAETLLLRSRIPVFLANPSIEAPHKIERVLFATDFSAPAHRALKRVGALSSTLGAKLIVYHKLSNFVPVAPPLAPAPVPYYLTEEKGSAEGRVQELVAELKHQGVDAEGVVDESVGDVTSSLKRWLDAHPVSLLALASQAGPIASVLLGSTTRQLVRVATRPVLILHEAES